MAVSGDSPAAQSAALSAARVVLHSRNFLTRERIGGASFVSAQARRAGDRRPPARVRRGAGRRRDIAGLTTFALRASEALRAADRAREAERELDRTRALLDVVGQATAQLSVQHAVATAVEHAGVLLGAERVAVYLREGKRLELESASNLVGPHERVAEGLLELVLGRYRGRGIVVVPDLDREPALADVRDAAAEAGIHAALALPLVAGGEAIGLLAVYPDQGAVVADHDETLFTALATQLAIAVHNARLHERANMLAAARDRSLAAERETARRLRALYEISQSFAQSLSLEATLEALARSAVELLDVDAAVIRMPDARRELLTTRAYHVRDTRLEPAVRPVLVRPQAFDALAIQRLFRTRRPIILKPQLANELGGSHRLLAPFLEKGSTAAILPIATPGEVVATLDRHLVRPAPTDHARGLQTALSIAAQAALAIDNGRLYQQQKEFADTMQRSLLPRSHPQLSGLEIGEVYESSARVDVGGDVYDFVELGDGQARRRARRRHGPRDRGDRRHGDGQVRLSLARARALGARRLPRVGERGRRRRDRRGQVHHDGLSHRRRRDRRDRRGERRPSRAAARLRRGRGDPARRARPRARSRLRSGVRRACGRTSRRAGRSSSTPTASSRLD